jgi:deoxycytidylate deaminase
LTLLPKYLEIARKQCVQHKFDKEMSFRHSALIVAGGRIISTGFNSHHNPLRFDPELARKAGRYRNENHAECSAILGFLARVSHENSAKMYVVRVLKNGTICNSRPCDLCSAVIKNCGFIKRVIYSITETEYGVLYPS